MPLFAVVQRSGSGHLWTNDTPAVAAGWTRVRDLPMNRPEAVVADDVTGLLYVIDDGSILWEIDPTDTTGLTDRNLGRPNADLDDPQGITFWQGDLLIAESFQIGDDRTENLWRLPPPFTEGSAYLVGTFPRLTEVEGMFTHGDLVYLSTSFSFPGRLRSFNPDAFSEGLTIIGTLGAGQTAGVTADSMGTGYGLAGGRLFTRFNLTTPIGVTTIGNYPVEMAQPLGLTWFTPQTTIGTVTFELGAAALSMSLETEDASAPDHLGAGDLLEERFFIDWADNDFRHDYADVSSRVQKVREPKGLNLRGNPYDMTASYDTGGIRLDNDDNIFDARSSTAGSPLTLAQLTRPHAYLHQVRLFSRGRFTFYVKNLGKILPPILNAGGCADFEIIGETDRLRNLIAVYNKPNEEVSAAVFGRELGSIVHERGIDAQVRVPVIKLKPIFNEGLASVLSNASWQKVLDNFSAYAGGIAWEDQDSILQIANWQMLTDQPLSLPVISEADYRIDSDGFDVRYLDSLVRNETNLDVTTIRPSAEDTAIVTAIDLRNLPLKPGG